MPIDNYPTIQYGGPFTLKLLDLDPNWDEVTTEQIMDDGGADYNLEGDEPILMWEIQYDGLTETEAKILDDHRALAKGKTQSFTFIHPRTGIQYTGVRYDEYQPDHSKVWIQSRAVRLIKRP
jgi:hypothetical protein